MTIEEANQVIKIMMTADDYCPYCTSGLLKKFIKKFPEYKKMCKEEFEKEFPKHKDYLK
jgi:hypothetical protein